MVIDRFENELRLGGLIHRIIISAEANTGTDSDIGFLEIVPSNTALLDYEDIVALRDWAQSIIDWRETGVYPS